MFLEGGGREAITEGEKGERGRERDLKGMVRESGRESWTKEEKEGELSRETKTRLKTRYKDEKVRNIGNKEYSGWKLKM